MRKHRLIILVAVLIVLASMAVVVDAREEETDMEIIKLIAVSDAPETEIEVVVDGVHHTEVLCYGFNVMTYKAEDPESLKVVLYGCDETPRINYGGKGIWYAYTFVKKPKESVGECYESVL